MNAEPLHVELRSLEERRLRPDVRRSPEELGELLADNFREFGSSGRAYDRQQTIAALQSEPAGELALDGFQAVALSREVALVTYRAECTARDGSAAYSLCSSIWRRAGGRWQTVFHQGTPAIE